jgi:hypothetical protein
MVSGTPAVPTSLSVNTAAGTTMSQLKEDGGGRIRTAAYGLGLASLALFWPVRRRKAARLWAMLICTVAFATLGLNGCSGGGGSNDPAKTAPGTYNFTITASSGSVQTQSSYTLVVQ